MKKIVLVCLAALMGAGIASTASAAQKKEKKMTTTVFATDIDCEHCVQKVLGNVPALGRGIEDVRVDLQKKEITVVYDAAKNDDRNIVRGLATLKVKAAPRNGAGGAEPGK